MPRAVPIEVADNFLGVNRREDQQTISRRELWTAQNLYPVSRGALETRLGATRFNAMVWTDATRGRSIIRYYPAGGTARKIAALNVAGNDVIVYGNDGAGTLLEMTGATNLTANKQWLFTVYQGGLYMGNATEAIQKTTDGTTRADIGGSPAAPLGYPGPVYRSRLTFFGAAANPKRLSWTNTFSEDVPATNFLTIEHPEDISAAAVFGRDEDRGVFGDLAIFTPTSTWIQRQDFGDLSAGASLDRATDRIGCPSPLTLQETPYGLVGLGYDGTDELVVFLIPVGGGRPIVISDSIRTAESLPLSYRNIASAGYHKGFYRLSLVPSGQTTPNREWWADLRYFNTTKANYNIGWFGPMSGRTIGAYAVQDQGSDTNQLIAVDGAAGHIDMLDPAGTYTDFGNAYTAIFETKYMDGGNPLYYKTFQGAIIGAKATADENVACRLDIDEGGATANTTLQISGGSLLVGDTTLVGDETLVVGGAFGEYVQYLASPLWGRRMAVRITYTGGRLFGIKRAAPIGSATKRMVA